MQVLGRQWLILTSEGQQHAMVPRGSAGVVGCTPILKPGECFQYYSATDLSTPSGKPCTLDFCCIAGFHVTSNCPCMCQRCACSLNCP